MHKRLESPVSRILFLFWVTPQQATIIHLMDTDIPVSLATDPEARAGRPRSLPYLVLHRVGFTQLLRSPEELVRSYRTVSPLP